MREHPYLGPPLHAFSPTASARGSDERDADVRFARQEYDEEYTLPSELATGGRVGWKRFEADESAWVSVQYPDTRCVHTMPLSIPTIRADCRWEQLRAEHGWSALQYTAILRTRISIPATPLRCTTAVRVDAHQVVEYAFIPATGPVDIPLTWYQGDIYDYASSLSGKAGVPVGGPSNLARSVELRPGDYVLLVRAMYEIRMFGDPSPGPPTVRYKMDIHLDGGLCEAEDVELVQGLAVLPDVLDGELMGDWMSIPLRAHPRLGQAEVVGVRCEGGECGIDIEHVGDSWRVLGGQMRPLALRIRQHRRIDCEQQSLPLLIDLSVDGDKRRIQCRLKLHQRRLSEKIPFMITFASPTEPRPGHLPSLVSFAMVVPPRGTSTATSPFPGNADAGMGHDRSDYCPPVLLALHGAGVDVRNTFWADAIPDRPGGWAVLPQGKTEWGEDWHGGSMDDAWAGRDALSVLVQSKLGMKLSNETM